MTQNCEDCKFDSCEYYDKPCVECVFSYDTQSYSNFEPKTYPNHQEDLNTHPVDKYPQYYKSTFGHPFVDVYAVHALFDVKDTSGALHHASKKILLSGVRTGGKPACKDIEEARDTLTRWLELNKHE